MTKRPVPPLARLIALLLAVPALAAWDAAGHRTVAEIAWEHMTPRARARSVDLLMHGPAAANLRSLRPGHGADAERDRGLFLNAATWSDLIRAAGAPRHVYNRPVWHYADFYWDTVGGSPHDIPGAGPDAVNAGERIVAFRAILSDSAAADTTKALALAWLLHLVGDMHQPLHCSSRVTPEDPLPDGDKGGNAFLLDAHNLHWYWDGILTLAIAREPAEDSLAYATRLARRIQGAHSLASLGTAAASADVAGWEKEGLQVAQTIVYAGVTRGGAPSAAYKSEALKVSERRIALAGYRLAELLNQALK